MHSVSLLNNKNFSLFRSEISFLFLPYFLTKLYSWRIREIREILPSNFTSHVIYFTDSPINYRARLSVFRFTIVSINAEFLSANRQNPPISVLLPSFQVRAIRRDFARTENVCIAAIQLMENLRTKRKIEIENNERSGNRGQREWRYRNTMENAGEKNYKRRGGEEKRRKIKEKRRRRRTTRVGTRLGTRGKE